MNERLFTELRRTSNQWILRTIERASFLSRRVLKKQIVVDIDGDQLLQIYKRTEGRKLPFIKRKTVLSFPLPLGLYEKKNIPLIVITLNGKPVQVIPQEEIRDYGFRRLSDSLDGLTKVSDPNLRDFVQENNLGLRRWLRIFLETSQEDVQESKILNLMDRRTTLSKILPYFFGKIESELLERADKLYRSFLERTGRFLLEDPQGKQFSGSARKHVITVMIPFFAISSWSRQQEGGNKKNAEIFIRDLQIWDDFLEHLVVSRGEDKERIDRFFRSLVFRTGYTHLAVHITGKEEELRGRWKIKMEYTNAYEPINGTVRMLRALSKATSQGISWPEKAWWWLSNVSWEGFLTKHVVRLETLYLGGKSYHFYFEVPSTYSSIARVYPLAGSNHSHLRLADHCFHDYVRVSNQEDQERLMNSNGYMVVVQLSRLLVLFFGLGLAIMLLFIYEPLLRNFSTVAEIFSSSPLPSLPLGLGIKEAFSYKLMAKNSFLSVFNIFPWLLILVAIPFNSFLTDQGLSYVWKSMGVTLFFSVIITGITVFSAHISLGLYLLLFLVNIALIMYFALEQRLRLKDKDRLLLTMIKEIGINRFYRRD